MKSTVQLRYEISKILDHTNKKKLQSNPAEKLGFAYIISCPIYLSYKTTHIKVLY